MFVNELGFVKSYCPKDQPHKASLQIDVYSNHKRKRSAVLFTLKKVTVQNTSLEMINVKSGCN